MQLSGCGFGNVSLVGPDHNGRMTGEYFQFAAAFTLGGFRPPEVKQATVRSGFRPPGVVQTVGVSTSGEHVGPAIAGAPVLDRERERAAALSEETTGQLAGAVAEIPIDSPSGSCV